MAATETTRWQYNLFCAATGYVKPEIPDWGSNGANPIVNVSWYDAVTYANWLSIARGLQPVYIIDSVGRSQLNWSITADLAQNGYRLPSEYEWQYAATHAGRDTFDYAGSHNLDEVGWYWENSGNCTYSVAARKANGLGLYDMSGNVWEWCWDWYKSDYSSELATNPTGRGKGSYRVNRGGSWINYAEYCRTSIRGYTSPGNRNDILGFRLASSPQ